MLTKSAGNASDNNFNYEWSVNNGRYKMNIIDIGGKDGTCAKCHVELSSAEKRSRIPICIKCITELVNIVKGDIDMDSIDVGGAIEEFSDDVSNFTDFVSSSARLMGLDDIVIIQVCFNIYMDTVRETADGNPIIARKIFKDARRFIDIELERLEDSGQDDVGKNGDWGKRDFIEKMMGSLSKMMKDCHDTKGGNDDTQGRNDNAQSRNDDVSGESCNINNRNFDHIPYTNSDGNGASKEGETKKDGEAGVKRKRIRVD